VSMLHVMLQFRQDTHGCESMRARDAPYVLAFDYIVIGLLSCLLVRAIFRYTHALPFYRFALR